MHAFIRKPSLGPLAISSYTHLASYTQTARPYPVNFCSVHSEDAYNAIHAPELLFGRGIHFLSIVLPPQPQRSPS